MTAGRKHQKGTPHEFDKAHLRKNIEELEEISRRMREMAGSCAPIMAELNQEQRLSGMNLLHYLALRRRDIRPLQDKLATLGLSSLGRTEAHVMASVNAVLQILHQLAGLSPPEPHDPPVGFADGRAILDQHTDALLGPKPGSRRVRIMVTMPSEAADDYLLVREILASGMDCMRINCAHDNAEAWQRMIDNLRRAKRELGKKCRILMDLAGPKLRTGPVAPIPQVIKWRPHRDRFGRVLEPARIWLAPEGCSELPDAPTDAILPLPGEWLAPLRSGDTVEFRDTRGAPRIMKIVGEIGPCRWGESDKTSYVASGTIMCRRKAGNKGKLRTGAEGAVGELPAVESAILLKRGDTLVLTRDLRPGMSARYDDRGRLLSTATIGCTLPEMFTQARPGERIWLDDGKIGGIIRSVGANLVRVEITAARPQGEKLRAEKGINLPDSKLTLSALTDKDLADLSFVVRHAHMVGISFIQNVDDIFKMQSLLTELGEPNLGVLLKIETRRGFEMLPDLLFAAMRGHAVGVMIARGDLAVECGYERLAEVQEEILWLCEAAHVPVIWATQVLETLARSGLPSRAEITDAAMGERAECVMLNKGPHIGEAMRVLDNILQRMEAHQSKKSPMLRQLRWWEMAQTHCAIQFPTE
jgi:pyruvate kinase